MRIDAMKKRPLWTVLLAAMMGAAAWTTDARAGPDVGGVYDSSASLAGSRSTNGGGLVGFNTWSNEFSLKWNIATGAQNGLNLYEYAFSIGDRPSEPNTQSPSAISHFVLDLTDGLDFVLDPSTCPNDADGCIIDPRFGGTFGDNMLNGDAYPTDDIEIGDNGDISDSVKFDDSTENGSESGEEPADPYVVEFLSPNSPVYHHFLAKGGGGSTQACGDAMNNGTDFVCNAGLLDGDPEKPMNFVAAPNSRDGTPVPAPATLGLLGAGLIGLGLVARRGRSRT